MALATRGELLQAAVEMATYQKQQWQQLVQFPWRSFQNRDTRRQFEVIADLGMATLPPERFQQLGRLIGQMQGTYSTAKVCDFHNRTKCNLSLEPELVQLLANSGDADELRHAWVEWRRVSGEKVRGLFEQYVAISNEAAALNNYTDLSGLWLKAYETPNFREELQRLWEQMRPLYQQLHAYVRRHLRMRYGDAEVTQQGPIPAHLLGTIKQCTRVDMKDLYVVHHEMGHVQYFLQYKEQPLIFRRGANPGIFEKVKRFSHHVATNSTIRYFVSSVLQFQIHRALCLEAGEFDPNDANKPLHNCDIHGSAAAGEKLKAMLRLGSSRPWPEALEAVTGSRHMDASGLLDYFRPLKQWLEEENQRNGENVGWVPSTRVCVATREELAILRSRNSTDSAFTRTASTEP
ncbi:Angiotensin-converting enzyme [Gryllus bimaculatus]|nr:Angiotensin-converting enzyme [Gryllus bimaculatus]